MPQVATKLVMEERGPSPSPFEDLLLGAKLELYACLHLLSERALFLTGATWAAIALREGEQFIYRAAAGNGTPEIGAEAEFSPEVSVLHPFAKPDERSLIAGVAQDSNITAFIHLVSESFDFGDQDLQAVSRLAEIIGTAIEHMHAAEQSSKLIVSDSTAESAQELVLDISAVEESEESAAPTDVKGLEKTIPLFWHAPAGVPPSTSSSPRPAKNDVAVHLCESCGFPVSPERKVCMDCDERGARVPPALFSSENSASWISNYGYTIASLLLPALAAALIYWLR